MAPEPTVTSRQPEEYAADVDVGCRPGEAGHTAVPCVRCEVIRAGISAAITRALNDVATRAAARRAEELRLRVATAQDFARARQTYELLKKAFGKLRVVLSMDTAEAGRIAHEAWIGLMLERGFHPFTECPAETACANCDHELLPWDDLPEARRLVREAGVEALFRELKRRAGLDVLEAEDLAAARAVAAMRDGATADRQAEPATEGDQPAKAEEGAP